MLNAPHVNGPSIDNRRWHYLFRYHLLVKKGVHRAGAAVPVIFGTSTTNLTQSPVFDQDLSLNSAENRTSSGRCDRSVRLGPVAPANADGSEP